MTSCVFTKVEQAPGETEGEAAHYLAEMAENMRELEILVNGFRDKSYGAGNTILSFSSGEEYRIDGRNNRTTDLCKAGNG